MNCPRCNAQLPMGAAFCSVCGTPVQQAPQPTVQQQPGGIPPQKAVPPQGIYQQPAYISPQGFQQQPGAVPPQGAVPSQGIQTHGNVRPQGAFSVQQGYSQQLGYVPPQGFPQQPPQGFQQQYVPQQGFPQQQPQGFQQQPAFIPPRGPQQQPCAVPSAPPAPKRFKIFLIFWFWLGWFGAHDFYAGFIGRGVIHVCIVIAAVISALFSFDIGVSLLSLANFIWLIYEIVNALNKKKDANGNIMIEFDQTQPSADGPQTGKSFKTYLLLGVFLGLLGIHDFYAGYIRLGLMHVWLFIVGSVIDVILCAVTTLPLIVFGLIHTIWLTIELASMLDKKKDMKGNIMIEFQQPSGRVPQQEGQQQSCRRKNFVSSEIEPASAKDSFTEAGFVPKASDDTTPEQKQELLQENQEEKEKNISKKSNWIPIVFFSFLLILFGVMILANFGLIK